MSLVWCMFTINYSGVFWVIHEYSPWLLFPQVVNTNRKDVWVSVLLALLCGHYEKIMPIQGFALEITVQFIMFSTLLSLFNRICIDTLFSANLFRKKMSSSRRHNLKVKRSCKPVYPYIQVTVSVLLLGLIVLLFVSPSQSLMLSIAKGLLEAEAKQKEEERRTYMEENCPPLSLPGSLQELQVCSDATRTTRFCCHFQTALTLLYLWALHLLKYQLTSDKSRLSDFMGHCLSTYFLPPRNFANSFTRKLTKLMRNDMTWKAKWTRVLRR